MPPSRGGAVAITLLILCTCILSTTATASELHKQDDASCSATLTSEADVGKIPHAPARFGRVPRALVEAAPALSSIPKDLVRRVVVGRDTYVDLTAATCLAARFVDLDKDGIFQTSRLTPPLSQRMKDVIASTVEALSTASRSAGSTALRVWLAIVGHNRSGSTLLGSLLDAHENACIANELNSVIRHALMSAVQHAEPLQAASHAVTVAAARHAMDRRWSLELALRGTVPCGGDRVQQEFNYTVPGGWQGSWAGEVPLVLGDKNTDNIVHPSYMPNMTMGLRHLGLLHDSLDVPFRYVQVIRNPLDTIVTEFLRDVHEALWWLPLMAQYDADKVAASPLVRHIVADAARCDLTTLSPVLFGTPTAEAAWNARHCPGGNLLLHHVRRYFVRYDRVQAYRHRLHTAGFRPTWAEDDAWLDVHAESLARNVEEELSTVCTFVGLQCSPEYLRQCRSIVRPSLPVRRFMIDWPQGLLDSVRHLMATRPLLARYAREPPFAQPT